MLFVCTHKLGVANKGRQIGCETTVYTELYTVLEI